MLMGSEGFDGIGKCADIIDSGIRLHETNLIESPVPGFPLPPRSPATP
jgi:hypothetical protein